MELHVCYFHWCLCFFANMFGSSVNNFKVKVGWNSHNEFSPVFVFCELCSLHASIIYFKIRVIKHIQLKITMASPISRKTPGSYLIVYAINAGR